MRGKLVPQDPNDEPASELLKRIAEEKARLVSEGKVRKQKPLAEIGAEEKPFDVPTNWEWVRVAAVGHDWGRKPQTKHSRISTLGLLIMLLVGLAHPRFLWLRTRHREPGKWLGQER